MSIMFTGYKCTHCDFDGADVTPNLCYYLIGDLRIPMEKSLGWCYNCRSLRSVEVLPNAEDEAVLEHRLVDLQAELAQLMDAPLPPGRWWQRKARGLAERRARLSELKSRVARMEEHLADNRLLREVLSKREGKGRCLTCQSEDNQLLPPHEVSYYESDPVKVGFNHPGCEGELVNVHQDLRFYVRRLPEKLYDIECFWLGNKTSLDQGSF